MWPGSNLLKIFWVMILSERKAPFLNREGFTKMVIGPLAKEGRDVSPQDLNSCATAL